MPASVIFREAFLVAESAPLGTDSGSDEDLLSTSSDASCLERMAACPDWHSCPIGASSGTMTKDSEFHLFLSSAAVGIHRTGQSR